MCLIHIGDKNTFCAVAKLGISWKSFSSFVTLLNTRYKIEWGARLRSPPPIVSNYKNDSPMCKIQMTSF